ncbi:cysteine proteinase [Aureobasidium subglaciale]|nr:cysteine proteinase [Aureobasidium subglaciale]
MENTTQARSRSLPLLSTSTSKVTDTPKFTDSPQVTETPAVTRFIPQSPPQKTPAKAAAESPKLSKKRPISETEIADAKGEKQTKKSRKEDAQSKKSGAHSPKDANRQSATEKKSTPVVTKQKDPKPESKPTKARKEDPSSHKASRSSLVPTAKVSQSWPASIGKQKIKGLSNPSQWCYRRSVLQSLIAVPQLFNVLDESHRSCPKQGKCVTCAMRQLLISYHTSPGNVGAQLGALDGAIRVTGKSSDPRWSAVGHTQEDSHDFLQYLLGTFEKAKGVHKDQFASLFRIKHKISWTCDGCKKVHTHSDPPGFSLSLPIPKLSGTVNLTNCLDTYHREPNVIIRCDKCKKNVKRTRIFQLDNAPDVLPIQLMRFGYGPRGSTKNKQHVDYPDELDLSPWAVEKSKPSKYRLQAIVAHSGSLKFGHYIAYVRSADGIKEISDSSVQSSSAKEWRRPTSGFDPYILVYIKQ